MLCIFFESTKGHETKWQAPVIVLTKVNTIEQPDVFLCVRLQQKRKDI